MSFKPATLRSPPAAYTTTELSARQAAAAETFKRVNKTIMPTGFDLTAIVFPTLGHRMDLGEHDLERYNRTYNLLRGISHVFAPTRWKEKFVKPEKDRS